MERKAAQHNKNLHEELKQGTAQVNNAGRETLFSPSHKMWHPALCLTKIMCEILFEYIFWSFIC